MGQTALARLLSTLALLVLAGLALAAPVSALPTTLDSVPDCSQSGLITLRMDAHGETPQHFNYKVNDGQTQQEATTDETATLRFGEGRRKLEYWANTDMGDDSTHQIDTVLVDQTNPNVTVKSDQNKALYVIKRQASVTVDANDALSGLTGNPSGQNQAVGTESRGKRVIEKTAVDRCGNTKTDRFEYTVLGPVLGSLTVVEPLGKQVDIRVPGAARTSQKGQSFKAIKEPREIPVGSSIDTRRGAARITSSRGGDNTTIQDGTFLSGVFQVLQSRKRRSKGLTELRLKGSSFKRCRSRRRAKRASTSAKRRRLSRRTVRRLRGNARGRFRTRGRYSAATVRGTKWVTTDRCDGTLTKVTRGRVAVRDFRRKKTILLRRGKSYLARALLR